MSIYVQGTIKILLSWMVNIYLSEESWYIQKCITGEDLQSEYSIFYGYVYVCILNTVVICKYVYLKIGKSKSQTVKQTRYVIK